MGCGRAFLKRFVEVGQGLEEDEGWRGVVKELFADDCEKEDSEGCWDDCLPISPSSLSVNVS